MHKTVYSPLYTYKNVNVWEKKKKKAQENIPPDKWLVLGMGWNHGNDQKDFCFVFYLKATCVIIQMNKFGWQFMLHKSPMCWVT